MLSREKLSLVLPFGSGGENHATASYITTDFFQNAAVIKSANRKINSLHGFLMWFLLGGYSEALLSMLTVLLLIMAVNLVSL